MPIATSVMHLLSVFVIAVAGGGVILWALMSTPRIRWDRFWIGVGLLLVVAPIALIVTVVRMEHRWDEDEGMDGEFDRAYVGVDTTLVVDTFVAGDSAGFGPVEAR
jgi:hypothetical protein